MDINVKGKGKLLFFIYSAIILCVLFFLLVFPMLKNPGSTVTFDSDPQGISVWIGKDYVGATPCKAFVPKGDYTVEFKHTGFETGKVALKVGNRSRCKAFAELKLTDADAIINQSFTEYATYGLTGPFSQSYQPQPVLTEAVKVLSGYQDKARIEEFLLESLKCAFSDYLIKDFINAYSLLKTGSMPAQDEKVLANAACTLLKDNNDALYHLSNCTGNIGQTIASKTKTNAPELPASTALKVEFNTILGHSMRIIPAGNYVLGNRAKDIPCTEKNPSVYTRTTDGFYISEQITKEQYQKFLQSEPKWNAKPEFDLESSDTVNASSVSWYAADAYCKWLTERLPADLKGKFYFRLPTEYEWEIAAKLDPNGSQKLWDWCDNWYYGAETFYRDCVPSSLTGAEKAVRGGSEHIWTRGCQPADWATPFIGFRVVLTGE